MGVKALTYAQMQNMQAQMYWASDNAAARTARRYGLTSAEVEAFVQANDNGVSFEELADILESAPTPRSKNASPEREKFAHELIAKLNAATLKAREQYAHAPMMYWSGVPPTEGKSPSPPVPPVNLELAKILDNYFFSSKPSFAILKSKNTADYAKLKKPGAVIEVDNLKMIATAHFGGYSPHPIDKMLNLPGALAALKSLYDVEWFYAMDSCALHCSNGNKIAFEDVKHGKGWLLKRMLELSKPAPLMLWEPPKASPLGFPDIAFNGEPLFVDDKLAQPLEWKMAPSIYDGIADAINNAPSIYDGIAEAININNGLPWKTHVEPIKLDPDKMKTLMGNFYEFVKFLATPIKIDP
jgi:hypothetical protein